MSTVPESPSCTVGLSILTDGRSCPPPPPESEPELPPQAAASRQPQTITACRAFPISIATPPSTTLSGLRTYARSLTVASGHAQIAPALCQPCGRHRSRAPGKPALRPPGITADRPLPEAVQAQPGRV